jgi:ferredoxin
VFQLDADEKSGVVDPGGAPDATILAAARSCPVKAITVVKEETGEQLFPPLKK